MTDAERDRFDRLLDEALAALPPMVSERLAEVPVIVDDAPDHALIAQLRTEFEEPEGDFSDLCGLHSGLALTERSVEASELPEDIRLFRRGILELAGGWDQPNADDRVYEEIVVTILHEFGHHFGLDEDDLAALGYD